MRIAQLIERFVFKRRFLYQYDLDAATEHTGVHVYLAPFEQLPETWRSQRLQADIARRNTAGSWVLFCYEEHGQMLGYSFLHTPATTQWMDALPTRPGEARTSASFVEETQRGRGIRGRIFDAQKTYCRTRALRLWAVIEASNLTSQSCSRKNASALTGHNYLLKVAGHNVLSITTAPWRLHWVAQRKNTDAACRHP